MSGGVVATWRQVRFTNKTFWRNPASAFFTFVFPLMFLVIFSVLFGGSSTEVAGRSIPVETFYVPGIAVFSVITACFTNIAISVTFDRDNGILKRIQGTPLPGWAYILGRVVHAVFVAVLLVVLCVAFGVLFYDVSVPTRTLPAFVVTMVVGAGAFTALGLAIVAAIPNADAAPAVVNAAVLPLLFVSNVFIPLEAPPRWLDVASSIFPVRPFADAALASFFAPTGGGWEGGDLLVLAAWGVGGLVLAARFFTWRPRV